MQSLTRTALLFLFVFAIAMASVGVAQAQTDFVYLNLPSATNQVYGYSVTAAGAFTPVAGSPFLTGGAGLYATQNQASRMVVNQAKGLLFVSNESDKTISVMSISAATGALTPVAGSPFAIAGFTAPAFGAMPLAVSPDGNLLYVAGQPGQFAVFSVDVNGVLTQLASQAYDHQAIPNIKISPNGQFLAAATAGAVSVYSIGLNGALTAVTGSPFSPATLPTGTDSRLEFSCPSDKLYVGESPLPSAIDAWAVAPSGALTPLTGSPFTNATTAYGPDMVLSPDGTILLQPGAGAANNAVLPFAVNLDGSLTVGAAVPGTTFNTAPQFVATNSTGSILYVTDWVNGAAASAAAYSIQPDGALAGDGGGGTTVLGSSSPFAAVAAYPARSCALADLSLSMAASPATVAPGSNVTYTITATNNGPSVSAFTVGFNVNTTTGTFVSCSSIVGTCDKGKGIKHTITFPALGPGVGATGTIVVKSATTLLNGDTMSNTAFTGNATTYDATPANNTATASVTATRTVVGSSVTVTAGSTGTYFGTATLNATIRRTDSNVGVGGRTINFSINGTPVGSAVSAANGIATLTGASLSGLNVGSYAISAVFAGDAGLTTSTGAGTVTVTKATLTVTPNLASKTYGDPTPPLSYTLTGFVNNETPAVTSGTGTCTSNSTAATHAGTANITCTAGTLTALNYAFATGTNNGALTINPAPLTGQATALSRLYGDPNPLLTGSAPLFGLRNGDSATATSFLVNAGATSPVGAYAIGAFVTAGAKFSATDYIIALDGTVPAMTTLGGSIPATLTVLPFPLTATATNVSRIYGDANPAFSGTLSATRNGDIIGVTFSSTATAASAVGTYPIAATLSGAGVSNYSVTTTGSLTITPAALSVTAGNASRIYGDANPVFAGTIVGIKNADNITATYASVDATAAVGPYAITPTLVDPGNVLGNYTVTSTNGTLTVTPAALSAVAANASRFYGDANPIFTGTLTGVKNADGITASFSSAALPGDAAGAYSIVPTLSDPSLKLGNYTVTLTNGVLTVGKAPLSVTADSFSRAYGDPNPTFTGTLVGVKNGDAITASFSSAATPASIVGSYPTVPALADPTAKLSNYIVTSTNGALTISKAPLTVTAGNVSRSYGAANPLFSGTITGLKNSDVITASYSTTATPASAVGNYSIVPALSDPGLKLTNYATTINNGTLAITKIPMVVTIANATRLTGDPNPAFTGTITGLVNGDAITANFLTTATVNSPAGTYPITAVLVDPTLKAGNYTQTFNNGVLTVRPRTITLVTPNGAEVWPAGTAQTISWVSDGATGNLNIALLKAGVGVRAIATVPSTTNSFTWTLPGTLVPGADYTVRISTSTGSIVGVSAAPFSIVAPLTVTSPNGGEQWAAGISQTVTWSSVGITGNVNIALMKAGVAVRPIGTAPVAQGSFTFTLPFNQTLGADYTVRITSATDGTVVDVSNAPFSVVAPITIASPNGGEAWPAGTAQTITWSTVGMTGNVNIALLKGGVGVAAIGTAPASAGSFVWNVPATIPVGADYTVRIVSATSGTLFDFSNAPFSIVAPLTVLTPNGGEQWAAGVPQTITWTSNGITGNVAIALLKAGAAVRAIATVPVTAGSFTWTPPAGQTLGSDYTIRLISTTNGAIVDVSNAPFSIVAPITVLSPNGGETWAAGTPQTVTWSTVGLTGNVNIALLKAGAGVFSIGTAPATAGTFTFTPPATLALGADYTVRILSATNGALVDVSNAPFSVVAPITVLSPNGGEQVPAGIPLNITWSSVNVTGTVSIALLKAGAAVQSIATAVPIANGTFTWNVPATLALTNTYTIRVTSDANGALVDVSNAAFSVVPALTVAVPNGGEAWAAASTQTITWNSLGLTGNVNIALLKAGVGFQSIATAVPVANGSFSWTLPATLPVAADYTVRITSATNGAIVSVSGAPFSVIAPLTVAAPNGGEIWARGSVQAINWTSIGLTGNVNIALLKGGAGLVSIGSVPVANGTFSWTVPANLTPGADYTIRITSAVNGAIVDVSNAAFTIN